VRWDEEMQIQRMSKELGWKVRAAPYGDGKAVEIQVLDAEGVPVSGISGLVSGTRANEAVPAVAREITGVPGDSIIVLPLGKRGSWYIKVDVSRRQHRFVGSTNIDLGKESGP